MKQRKREHYRRYYNANKAKCNLSNKMSKLRTRGVVEWLDNDLTLKPRGRPRIYTKEEIRQHKRDYYNNCYYITNKEACLARMRNSCIHKKVMAQQLQAV